MSPKTIVCISSNEFSGSRVNRAEIEGSLRKNEKERSR